VSAIDQLKELVLQDRRFRQEAFDRARRVLDQVRRDLGGIVGMLGAGDDAYPVTIDQKNPQHLVALLGPRAVHIVLQQSVGVRKELVYSGEDTMLPLFQEIAAAPDHAHPTEHSVAIEFIRSSSQAFRLQAPAEALIFATLHVGPENCVLENKFLSKSYPSADVATWMPEVLATLLSQSLSWGISVWPGARAIEYGAVLETRLIGLPAPGTPVRDKRIGFEPPRRGDELAGEPGDFPGKGPVK
jgi:hypothetical protein